MELRDIRKEISNMRRNDTALTKDFLLIIIYSIAKELEDLKTAYINNVHLKDEYRKL